MLLLIPGPVTTRPEVRAAMAQDFAPWVRDWVPSPLWTRLGPNRGGHDDIPLIFAKSHLHHWAMGVEAAAAGKTDIPADEMKLSQVHFRSWLTGVGRARYKDYAEYGIVGDLFDRLGALAGHFTGKTAIDAAALAEFTTATEQTLDALDALLLVSHGG